MQGNILRPAIPNCGFAHQGGVPYSVLYFKEMYLMLDYTVLFAGSFWEFFTLRVDSCPLDCSDQSESRMLVCFASQLHTNYRVFGAHRARWSSIGGASYIRDGKSYAKLKSLNYKG